MRGNSWAVVVLFALLVLGTNIKPVAADSGGGVPCGSCTLVLQLVFNLMVVDNTTFAHALTNYCATLPDPYANSCILFAETAGPGIIAAIGANASSDQICHQLGVCTDPNCNLFPSKVELKKLPRLQLPVGFSVEENNAWNWLLDVIDTWTDKHLPPFDTDGDKFAGWTGGFRGRDWKGRDCNPLSDKVYPGRKESTFPDSLDQDCNGISGRDSLGRSYEKQFCDPAERRGLIALGDSATAHFRIPPSYINASEITKSTYRYVLKHGFNELDFPHLSWATGHTNDTTGDCEGPVDSIYLNLWKRNRCNFRDFQNIGVNGARTSSMKPEGIINAMARNPDTDYPALVMFALIGNDVCSSSPSVSSMTPAAEFEQNVLASLDYLNSTLPKGSYVTMVGLAQGEILWDTMWNLTHPIGCTYQEFYDYLNCLQISPCAGWMNSDPAIRAATTAHAEELSAVYEKIIQNYSYETFEMAYHPFPLPEAIQIWTASGGAVSDLIEPVDGFHPSQIANSLLGQILFDWLATNYPDFVGAANTHNSEIDKIFGNQGGY